MENKKTALVTGANKGIGLATSRLLAEKGYQVWMGVRSLERGQQAYQELKANNFDAHLIQMDIADDASVTKASAVLDREIGKLDVLINNAGFAADLSISPSAESINAIREQYETNTFGPIRVTQQLLPLLKRSERASIIMVSSIVGSLTLSRDENTIYGQVNYAGYSSSKTALNALMLAYSKELKPFGIPVIAIEPGHIKTDLNSNTGTATPESAAELIVKHALYSDISSSGHFLGPDGELPW